MACAGHNKQIPHNKFPLCPVNSNVCPVAITRQKGPL